MKKGTESQNQQLLIKWLRLKGILFYHIPNEGKRSIAQARWLRNMGLQPGMPDICIPHARLGYHGLYIELKSEKGKLTKLQAWWLDVLSREGYLTCVAYGFDEAKQIIEDYFYALTKQ